MNLRTLLGKKTWILGLSLLAIGFGCQPIYGAPDGAPDEAVIENYVHEHLDRHGQINNIQIAPQVLYSNGYPGIPVGTPLFMARIDLTGTYGKRALLVCIFYQDPFGEWLSIAASKLGL